MRFLFTAAAAAALLASTAGAQVGYPPERSPYRDLEYRQELTLLTGYYAASADPAGVAPRSGPMLGLRYDVRVGASRESSRSATSSIRRSTPARGAKWARNRGRST